MSVSLNDFLDSGIYQGNFAALENDVVFLESLAKSGQVDYRKAISVKRNVDCLKMKIDDGCLHDLNWAWSTGDGNNDATTKNISLELDPASVKVVNDLKSIVDRIFAMTQSFQQQIAPQKYVCLSYDTQLDASIRKLPLPFPHLSSTSSASDELVIVADRILGEKAKVCSHLVYLRDPQGAAWKAFRIPIGPRPFVASATKLQILLKSTSETNEIQLTPLHTQLPLEQQKNLLEIIKQGRPTPGFCCLHFVDYMFGRYQQPNYTQLDYKKYVCTAFAIQKLCLDALDNLLAPGDAICLMRKFRADKIEESMRKHYDHFALYLGHGLFASLYGSIGGIVISTLQEMRYFTPHGGVAFIKYCART